MINTHCIYTQHSPPVDYWYIIMQVVYAREELSLRLAKLPCHVGLSQTEQPISSSDATDDDYRAG